MIWDEKACEFMFIAGSNCYPFSSWQAMPQITIGIGGGPMGGCMFPMSWPCFQQYPV